MGAGSFTAARRRGRGLIRPGQDLAPGPARSRRDRRLGPDQVRILRDPHQAPAHIRRGRRLGPVLIRQDRRLRATGVEAGMSIRLPRP